MAFLPRTRWSQKPVQRTAFRRFDLRHEFLALGRPEVCERLRSGRRVPEKERFAGREIRDRPPPHSRARALVDRLPAAIAFTSEPAACYPARPIGFRGWAYKFAPPIAILRASAASAVPRHTEWEWRELLRQRWRGFSARPAAWSWPAAKETSLEKASQTRTTTSLFEKARTCSS